MYCLDFLSIFLVVFSLVIRTSSCFMGTFYLTPRIAHFPTLYSIYILLHISQRFLTGSGLISWCSPTLNHTSLWFQKKYFIFNEITCFPNVTHNLCAQNLFQCVLYICDWGYFSEIRVNVYQVPDFRFITKSASL